MIHFGRFHLCVHSRIYNTVYVCVFFIEHICT